MNLKLGTGRRQLRRAIGVPGHRRSSGYDYDRAGIQGREHPRRWRRAEPTVEDDPDERPHAIDATRGEQRIVGEDGAGPDPERVDLRAFPMDASVGRLSRQSGPHAWRGGNLRVETERHLRRDERTPMLHHAEERSIQRRSFLLPHADRDLDSVVAKVRDAAAGHARIGILHGHDRTANPGFDGARRAGSGAALVAARLERAVQRRAASPRPCLVQGVHLCVRSTGELVRSTPDHHTLIVYDDRADHGIRTRTPAPAIGKRQCPRHVIVVGHESVASRQ